MITQCPDCRKVYPVTKKQLRGKKGQIFCVDCNKKFDAYFLLNQKPSALVAEAKTEYIPKQSASVKPKVKKQSGSQEPVLSISSLLGKRHADIQTPRAETDETSVEHLPWEQKKQVSDNLWVAGLVIGSLLFLGQLFYFESSKLSQSSTHRPKVAKICQWLGCQLPEYENLAELGVLQSTFTPKSDGTIEFKAVINNQSVFRQRLPNLELTLLDLGEQVISERVFTAKDYLQAPANNKQFIAPDETLSVKLIIVKPITTVGGYHFDLIH